MQRIIGGANAVRLADYVSAIIVRYRVIITGLPIFSALPRMNYSGLFVTDPRANFSYCDLYLHIRVRLIHRHIAAVAAATALAIYRDITCNAVRR